MYTFHSYLKSLLIKYKFYFFALFLTAIIASIFNIAVNYKIKEIIDTIAMHSHARLGLLLILFVLYKFMYHGMFFIGRLLDIKYKPLLLSEIVKDTYLKTVGHSLHWFDSHLSGEISSKISDIQNNIINLISYSFHALNSIATIIISIVFLLYVNTFSALVLLLFAIIYTPVITLLLKKQMELQQKYTAARQETLGIINDSIANIFGIKIIGNIYTEFKVKLMPALLNWCAWDKKTRQFDAYWVDNADTIMVTIMGAVQIYLLASLYQHGQITAGSFAFISMVTLNIHDELDKFLESLLFNINPSIAIIKTSLTFINMPYDVRDIVDAKHLIKVRGDIKFKNVYFKYSKNQPYVLEDFNVHILPGQRIGIVGASGAGKTTIVKCLLRYFDIQSGQILVDNEDIKTLTQESLRAHISIIPQDITLLHQSILENLKLAAQDANLEQIIQACKKARVHKDILRMPQGYYTVVGERGVKLSGGQRQRIAIARAILKNAPILILDEATSALDTPIEKLIQESLHEILETHKATTIVIAHRLSTLLHMDRILVLEQGKIIEDGAHQSLLGNNKLYKKLWDAQINGFLPHKESEELTK